VVVLPGAVVSAALGVTIEENRPSPARDSGEAKRQKAEQTMPLGKAYRTTRRPSQS
jgi:hypothetical protein